jgi:formylglycine-generating enzyme
MTHWNRSSGCKGGWGTHARTGCIALGLCLGLIVWSCTGLLGINKDYQVVEEDGAVGAGAATQDAPSPDASIEAASGGSAGQSVGGSGQGGKEAGSGNCSIDASNLVLETLPRGNVCIEATEVSYGQYRQFLACTPDLSRLPPQCGWKDAGTFHWASGAAGCPTGSDSAPVQAVDWCDAWTYCNSIGRRLCGEVDSGGALDPMQGNKPEKSEWFAACSWDGGLSSFTFCDCDMNGCPHDVTYPCSIHGVFALNGNLSEWENSCDDAGAGATALCRVRGGSCGSATITCDTPGSKARNAKLPNVGFRCCADVSVCSDAGSM